MIVSNKKVTSGHKKRHQLASQYKSIVDIYGGGIGKQTGIGRGPQKTWFRDKNESLHPYMFHIVVQNSDYDTYYTQKVTDCFASGTIPIYLGTRNIVNEFNKDGIIFLDQSFDIKSLSKQLYFSKMDAIVENLKKVSQLEMAQDYIVKNYIL